VTLKPKAMKKVFYVITILFTVAIIYFNLSTGIENNKAIKKVKLKQLEAHAYINPDYFMQWKPCTSGGGYNRCYPPCGGCDVSEQTFCE
jgi:hypothetical protein